MPNLPYKTAGWNTHSQTRLREVTPGLPEQEPGHYTVRRFYEGPSATFAGFAALNTPDTEFSDAKLVWQSGLVPTDGGCIAYERLFATVPASWSEPEEYGFPYPSYASTVTGSAFSATAITASTPNFVISTTATGIAPGDIIYCSLRFNCSGLAYTQSFFTAAVAASSGSSVTVGPQLVGSGSFSSVSGTVQKATAGRSTAETLIVSSRVQHDYALSSEAALDVDLPLIQSFSPVDAAFVVTNALTAGTTPTAAIYSGYVTSGVELVAESSTRRRYMGNIYCRRTRFVPAR